MNSIWGAELNYAPDYWPLWLIYAGVVIVLMIAGLVTHALLRRMLAPKTATGEEHRDYLYSLAVRRWHWGNALLFILLLLSGLFGHFSVGPVALMVQIHTWCGFALLAFCATMSSASSTKVFNESVEYAQVGTSPSF